jgi:hypothetical protein
VYFEYPQISADTALRIDEGVISLKWMESDVTFRFKDEKKFRATEKLLNLLQQEATHIDALPAKVEYLSQSEILKILQELDKQHLLIEGALNVEESRTGFATLVRLERAHAIWQSEAVPLDHEIDFVNGKSSKELLAGLAFEYFHITTMAYDALLPAMSRAHGQQQTILYDFVLGEYRHDRILVKSLLSLGYTDEQIAESIPHPYTAALTDMLGYWARTDDLAFKAALFIFEGTPESAQKYQRGLANYDLPEEYIRSHLDHDLINDQGGHHDISRTLFECIEYVSEEEEARITAKLHMLFRLTRQRAASVFEYYTTPGVAIPRTVKTLTATCPVQ